MSAVFVAEPNVFVSLPFDPGPDFAIGNPCVFKNCCKIVTSFPGFTFCFNCRGKWYAPPPTDPCVGVGILLVVIATSDPPIVEPPLVPPPPPPPPPLGAAMTVNGPTVSVFY